MRYPKKRKSRNSRVHESDLKWITDFLDKSEEPKPTSAQILGAALGLFIDRIDQEKIGSIKEPFGTGSSSVRLPEVMQLLAEVYEVEPQTVSAVANHLKEVLAKHQEGSYESEEVAGTSSDIKSGTQDGRRSNTGRA